MTALEDLEKYFLTNETLTEHALALYTCQDFALEQRLTPKQLDRLRAIENGISFCRRVRNRLLALPPHAADILAARFSPRQYPATVFGDMIALAVRTPTAHRLYSLEGVRTVRVNGCDVDIVTGDHPSRQNIAARLAKLTVKDHEAIARIRSEVSELWRYAIDAYDPLGPRGNDGLRVAA